VYVIAVIPARGGSRRVPGKNIVPVGGRPLIAYTIEQARLSRHVQEVIVSTDDPAIAAVGVREGAQVVDRPPNLASDHARSEDALLHALDARRAPDPDLVVFLQVTSPVRRPHDIDAAVDLLVANEADSLFSAVREAAFTWRQEGGELQSESYDWRQRPRSQEMQPRWRENGSIYVFRPWVLRQGDNRLGGRIAVYEMDLWSSVDLDAHEDAKLLDQIIRADRPNDV
jgi:CMP-N,N'-diacetyllegionaminic acid synthase